MGHRGGQKAAVAPEAKWADLGRKARRTRVCVCVRVQCECVRGVRACQLYNLPNTLLYLAN